MLPAVRFTIRVGDESGRSHGEDAEAALADGSDIAVLSARLVMQVGKTETDLGLRPLNMTLAALVHQTPLLLPQAAEEIFGRWLWAYNPDAAGLYREALEQVAELPARVAWCLRGPNGISFPDLPVEALAGGINAPAVYREVAKCANPLATAVGSYLPPVGSWRVAPVSLIPRHLLPQQRDPSREYDAIARGHSPILETLDTEYAVTRQRLADLLGRLGESHVQVLHLIADTHSQQQCLSLQDAAVTPLQLAEILSAGGWQELQLIVLSSAAPETAHAGFPWALMKLLPVRAMLCYQGAPRITAALLPFTERFYAALGAGYAVDEAVSRARASIRDSGRCSTPDVLAPVLYLREEREAPAIKSGDPGLEGLLAAAHALASARAVLDDPEVLQLVGQIPLLLSQIHSRLDTIVQHQIERLRRSRTEQSRILRTAGRRTPSTYTVSAAVAEQLKKVLSMAPAPAGGEAGRPAAAPPGLHWRWILQRSQRSLANVTFSRDAGPSKLYQASPPALWMTIERHRPSPPVQIALPGPTKEVNDADREGSTAVLDMTQWPTPLRILRCSSDEDEAYLAQLERDFVASAALTVRNLLKYHFREVLNQPPASSLPPGLRPTMLVRGALRSLGLKLHDFVPATHNDVIWPAWVYLLQENDDGPTTLLIARTQPDADIAPDEQWRVVEDFYNVAAQAGDPPSAIYVDWWPVDRVTLWQPSRLVAPPTTASWVWDRLPEALTEYRQLLLQRLWEWWIGALPPENQHV